MPAIIAAACAAEVEILRAVDVNPVGGETRRPPFLERRDPRVCGRGEDTVGRRLGNLVPLHARLEGLEFLGRHRSAEERAERIAENFALELLDLTGLLMQHRQAFCLA